MSNDWARVTGDRVQFTDTVSRITESLKPLGAAARPVAETYALNAEMQTLHRNRTRTGEEEIQLKLLDQRRRESSASLRQMREHLGRADASAGALRQCMVNMQRATVRPGIPNAERRAYVELTQHFTTALVQHHSDLTGGVAKVIDKVLNGSGATALTTARPGKSRRRGR
ncbi:hypothetical protein [Lentzea sp. NPDC059081]|uniref:hypothetical protein n=1 Tax=Lentzea sp. NPDC059081 TaxID=3346719 RepID=UPI0036B1B3F1